MKKAIPFSLVFLFLYTISFSQEEILDKPVKRTHSEFSTRIGLNSFNEINLHYEFFREGRPNILAAVAYHYQSKLNQGGGILCNKTVFIRKFTHRQGFSLRAGVRYFEGKPKIGKRLYAVYTYGNAPRIRKDESCSSGSNYSVYAFEEYDLESHRVGFLHYFDFNEQNKFISFYIGGGLFVQHGTKTNQRVRTTYFIESVPDDKELSMDFAFDFGMKINLFKLKIKTKS